MSYVLASIAGWDCRYHEQFGVSLTSLVWTLGSPSAISIFSAAVSLCSLLIAAEALSNEDKRTDMVAFHYFGLNLCDRRSCRFVGFTQAVDFGVCFVIFRHVAAGVGELPWAVMIFETVADTCQYVDMAIQRSFRTFAFPTVRMSRQTNCSWFQD